MTTKRKGARHVAVIRHKFADGSDLALPAADAMAAGARQLRALAAAQPDHPQRAEWLTKAAVYEQEARALASRQAIADERQDKRHRGGTAAAEQSKQERESREVELFKAAQDIWKRSPRLPIRRVAEMLSERKDIRYRSADDIRKRIKHLRPSQK